MLYNRLEVDLSELIDIDKTLYTGPLFNTRCLNAPCSNRCTDFECTDLNCGDTGGNINC
jgi:hypothetical protein